MEAQIEINSQEESGKSSRSILELSNSEARKFFLKGESFCKIELPEYFVFDGFLDIISEELTRRELNNEQLRDFCRKKLGSLNSEQLNHTIFKGIIYIIRQKLEVSPYLW